MLRMSCHVQAWNPGALDFALKLGGPFLKVMTPEIEPVAAILERHPHTQLIVRKFYSLEEQAERLSRRGDGGEQVANEVRSHFGDLLQWCRLKGIPYWVEGLNETGLWNDADAYNEFTVAFAQAVASWGGKPLAYSFPVGNPPVFEHWASYLPGLYACQRAGGGLALHQYGWPDVRHDADWLACRHRKVREVLPEDLKALPILVTECGLDKGVAGGVPAGVRPEDGAGWTNAGITPDQYADQLAWLDDEYNRDGILGATIFTVGGWWPSFDVTGAPEIADRLREAAKHHAPTAPVTAPQPLPAPEPVNTPPDSTEAPQESPMSIFAGRHAWVWYPSQVGGVDGIIARCQELGLDGVYLKIADGSDRWDRYVSPWDVSRLKTAGLKVFGWVYAYGRTIAEPGIHHKAALHFGVDGLIVDAEAEIRDTGRAATYARDLAAIAQLPLAVAPLPIRRYHSGLAYDVWADLGYALMPQAYVNVLGPTLPIRDILADWRTAYPDAVIVPAYGMYGQTGYSGDEGARYPTADDVAAFVASCTEFGCVGRSYWRLDTIDPAVLLAGDAGEDELSTEQKDEIRSGLDRIWATAQALRVNGQHDTAAALERDVVVVKVAAGLS